MPAFCPINCSSAGPPLDHPQRMGRPARRLQVGWVRAYSPPARPHRCFALMPPVETGTQPVPPSSCTLPSSCTQTSQSRSLPGETKTEGKKSTEALQEPAGIAACPSWVSELRRRGLACPCHSSPEGRHAVSPRSRKRAGWAGSSKNQLSVLPIPVRIAGGRPALPCQPHVHCHAGHQALCAQSARLHV